MFKSKCKRNIINKGNLCSQLRNIPWDKRKKISNLLCENINDFNGNVSLILLKLSLCMPNNIITYNVITLITFDKWREIFMFLRHSIDTAGETSL